MKTFEDFCNLLAQSTYKPGWEIHVHQDDHGIYLQVGVTTEAEISLDMITGKRVAWKGAKQKSMRLANGFGSCVGRSITCT